MPALGVDDHVFTFGDHRQDLGVTGYAFEQGVAVEGAEARGEGLERLGGEPLVAEEDDLVVEERAMDRLKDFVIHRDGEVHAVQLGAQGAR